MTRVPAMLITGLVIGVALWFTFGQKRTVSSRIIIGGPAETQPHSLNVNAQGTQLVSRTSDGRISICSEGGCRVCMSGGSCFTVTDGVLSA